MLQVPNLAALSLMQHVADEEMERLKRFARAWRHYEDSAPPVLPIAEDGSDDNVPIYSAETVVDKGAAFLFKGPGGVQLQTDDAKAVGKIAEVWPEDKRAIQLHDMAVNGGVTGHVFVRLRLDGRVIVLDPSTVYPTYSQSDIETVEAWRIQWPGLDDSGVPVVYRQRIEPEGNHWAVVDEKSIDQGRSWLLIREESWPYSWAPVLHTKNRPAPNQFWGKPDLTTGVLDLLEAMWALAGYMRRLVRHSGHPVPWITGHKASELENVEMALGKLLAIPNVEAKVGQWQATGDLGASLELYRTLKEEYREKTAMPEVAAGKLENIGQLSGFALQILYGPLLDRTGTKRNLYGPLACDIASKLLEIRRIAEGAVIVPVWTDPLPQDVVAETSALEADQRLGIVSKQTLAEKRGYDWEVEQGRMADEGQDLDEGLERTFDRV